jgi:hypothetical protein
VPEEFRGLVIKGIGTLAEHDPRQLPIMKAMIEGFEPVNLCTDLVGNRVAYLLAADNVSGPLPIRLPLVNQSVISTPNVFSTLLPSLLADI